MDENATILLFDRFAVRVARVIDPTRFGYWLFVIYYREQGARQGELVRWRSREQGLKR